MNKTTKGALGLGSAAVLLAGGAGSLAYWTDTVSVPSSTITAGSLDLSDPACAATWKYRTGTAGAGGANGGAVTTYVPGDKITKTCTFVVTATGQNLKATLTTPAATAATAATSLTLTPSASYSIAGTALVNGGNAITSANNGQTVTAVINVDIPFGTSGATGAARQNENDTQLTTATLNAITVNLTQVENTATS